MAILEKEKEILEEIQKKELELQKKEKEKLSEKRPNFFSRLWQGFKNFFSNIANFFKEITGNEKVVYVLSSDEISKTDTKKEIPTETKDTSKEIDTLTFDNINSETLIDDIEKLVETDDKKDVETSEFQKTDNNVEILTTKVDLSEIENETDEEVVDEYGIDALIDSVSKNGDVSIDDTVAITLDTTKDESVEDLSVDKTSTATDVVKSEEETEIFIETEVLDEKQATETFFDKLKRVDARITDIISYDHSIDLLLHLENETDVRIMLDKNGMFAIHAIELEHGKVDEPLSNINIKVLNRLTPDDCGLGTTLEDCIYLLKNKETEKEYDKIFTENKERNTKMLTLGKIEDREQFDLLLAQSSYKCQMDGNSIIFSLPTMSDFEIGRELRIDLPECQCTLFIESINDKGRVETDRQEIDIKDMPIPIYDTYATLVENKEFLEKEFALRKSKKQSREEQFVDEDYNDNRGKGKKKMSKQDEFKLNKRHETQGESREWRKNQPKQHFNKNNDDNDIYR